MNTVSLMMLADKWDREGSKSCARELLACMAAHTEIEVGEFLDEIRAGRRDNARLDWMEANLLRDTHLVDDDGKHIKAIHAWAIVGDLPTLRATVDQAIKVQSEA